jgi:hypothetical protein
MFKPFHAIGVLLILAIGAHAQTAPSEDSAALIQKLINRIDQLEKRVAELEGGKGVAPEVARPAPLVPEAAAPPDHAGMPMPEAQSGGPSLKIAGFSDFNFSATDQKGVKSGFNEGQFILHISSALSQKVTFMSELSLTARVDAGLGSPPAPGFNAEVERAIIRFEQNDYFKVSFGRYHTPINYWNTAFHHGAWLQTTVSRPEMTQFGGSFIPVHFVGALVEGAVPAGGLNLNYNVGLGNGRSSVISRDGDFGDVNNNRAWLVNLFVKPDKLYGLQVGGSVYRDKISPVTGFENREWIESAHVAWQKENPEFIAEFANVTHQRIGTSVISNSQAWYVQTAWRLSQFDRQLKPYYRYEYIHIPRADTIFRTVSGLSGSVVGIRYDISSFAALKFEYRNQRRPGLPRINGTFVQTAFTF